MSVPVEKVSEEILTLLFCELSPVCAIVGGVLAQEVIKVGLYILSSLWYSISLYFLILSQCLAPFPFFFCLSLSFC